MSAKWLVVDLDFTLLKNDLFQERLVLLLLRRPLEFLRLFFNASKGRPWLKSEVAKLEKIDPSLLPYREEVLTRIDLAKKAGTKVSLISASQDEWVQQVSEHLGCFDYAIGSQAVNLKGKNKADFIQRQLNGQTYTYLGDSTSDLHVWKHAESGVAYNPSASLKSQLSSVNAKMEYLYDHSNLKSWLKLLRPHQWIKNILVFIAPIAAHKIGEVDTLANSIAAMVTFSMFASAVYSLNDVYDIESDRKHPQKSKRPIASGEISAAAGLLTAIGLVLAGSALAFLVGLSSTTLGLLYFYLLANFVYSYAAKEVLGLDLIFLSVMYTLRIFVGAKATSIPVSVWLLSFSIFLFFGLACLKRLVELGRAKSSLSRRAYVDSDRIALLGMGLGSNFSAILILMLYLHSPEVKVLYQKQEILWGIVPISLYAVSRVWLLSTRGLVDDDPVVFALTDRPLHIAIALSGLVIWGAM